MSDYTDDGFDGFLSRSVDDLSQQNLDSQGPISTQMSFDRSQVSGMFGDTLQIGKVRIENQAIIINDGENDFLLMGEDGQCN